MALVPNNDKKGYGLTLIKELSQAEKRVSDYYMFFDKRIYIKHISDLTPQITLKSTGKYVALESLITNFTIVRSKITGKHPDQLIECNVCIHSSDVIGIYLNINLTTHKVIIPLTCSYTDILKHLKFEVGKYLRSKNTSEASGDWGKVDYRGGNWTLYPRSNFHTKTLMKMLKPILNHEI